MSLLRIKQVPTKLCSRPSLEGGPSPSVCRSDTPGKGLHHVELISSTKCRQVHGRRKSLTVCFFTSNNWAPHSHLSSSSQAATRSMSAVKTVGVASVPRRSDQSEPKLSVRTDNFRRSCNSPDSLDVTFPLPDTKKAF